MNTKEFTEQQRQPLLDLAVLAMYADGHLAVVDSQVAPQESSYLAIVREAFQM